MIGYEIAQFDSSEVHSRRICPGRLLVTASNQEREWQRFFPQNVNMDSAVAGSHASAPPAAFEDGLGERRHTVGAGNEPLEVLRLSTVLSAVSAFEFALRERASRLATFRHDSFVRVRAIERLEKLTPTLIVVSDYVRGTRLSEILDLSEKRGVPLETDAARCLIRQLVAAVATLHEALPDICHGAIAPERIIVTPDGRLVIVEHVLGAALEQLRYSQERYWKDLRIAMPGTVGPLRFDGRADVTQMGTVTLALLLGRRIGSHEYPERIDKVVSAASVRSAAAELSPLPIDLREWLVRSLQLDLHSSFASAIEARANLDFALGEAKPLVELTALRLFLAGCAPHGGVVSAPSRLVVAPVPVNVAPAMTDPDAGLEALKSFLTRYPSRAVPEKPPVSVSVAASPARAEFGGAAATGVTVAAVASPAVVAEPRPFAFVPASSTAPAVPAASIPPALPTATRWHRVLGVLLRREPTEEADSTMLDAIRSRRWLIAAAVGLVAFATGVTLAGLRLLRPSPVQATGTLVVATSPAGLAVFVDGLQQGPTPFTLSMTPGDHVLELVTESGRRRIPIAIAAGGHVSQFLELPESFETFGTPQTFGELQIRTEPPGASVTVDRKLFGRSPLTVSGLTPGVHTVVLENDSGTLTEHVTIDGGMTASLVVSMASQRNTNAAGWIAINAPADVQVFENQRLLGSSFSDRIMLPVGRHQLEIVNEALGYRASRSVNVSAGRVSAVTLDWPQGSLAINALPWAEVWIDGERVGETPIGSVSVPIGPHEIVFRHPELGERRSYTTVTAGEPTRVGVDLRAK